MQKDNKTDFQFSQRTGRYPVLPACITCKDPLIGLLINSYDVQYATTSANDVMSKFNFQEAIAGDVKKEDRKN